MDVALLKKICYCHLFVLHDKYYLYIIYIQYVIVLIVNVKLFVYLLQSNNLSPILLITNKYIKHYNLFCPFHFSDDFTDHCI